MTDLPPITLPAEHVIPAWRNAFLAASDDDGRPALYRTVLVEWYQDGLRFVATDSYVIVASYADSDRWADGPVHAPDHDEAPAGSVVAIATDKLMADFLKHRAVEVKAWAKADAEGLDPDPVDVTFSLGTIDEPNTGQQRLDIGDRRALIVSADNERIAIPLYEGDYPNWRAILAGYRPRPKAQVRATTGLLARLGQLRTRGTVDCELDLTMAAQSGGAELVLVTGTGRVPLEGAFVPRTEEAAEQDEAA